VLTGRFVPANPRIAGMHAPGRRRKLQTTQCVLLLIARRNQIPQRCAVGGAMAEIMIAVNQFAPEGRLGRLLHPLQADGLERATARSRAFARRPDLSVVRRSWPHGAGPSPATPATLATRARRAVRVNHGIRESSGDRWAAASPATRRPWPPTRSGSAAGTCSRTPGSVPARWHRALCRQSSPPCAS
jgi:hypothetical protein